MYLGLILSAVGTLAVSAGVHVWLGFALVHLLPVLLLIAVEIDPQADWRGLKTLLKVAK